MSHQQQEQEQEQQQQLQQQQQQLLSDDSFVLGFGDNSLSSMNTSLEIREIINDYHETIKTATEEIKSLNRSEFQLFPEALPIVKTTL